MLKTSAQKDPIIKFLENSFANDQAPIKAFIRMFESVTKDHDIFLGVTIGWLNTIIKKLDKKVNRTGHRRFICKLDISNKKKHWQSVADKLWREREKPKPEFDINNFHRVIKDLVRLRVVCNFLSDVKSFESALTLQRYL